MGSGVLSYTIRLAMCLFSGLSFYHTKIKARLSEIYVAKSWGQEGPSPRPPVL